MKNRLIAIAAGVIALGTTAFAQTRMTADVPFAFKTATGTLPAGTYEFTPRASSLSHLVVVRNKATGKSVFAGTPLFNAWNKAAGYPAAIFVCGASGCTLKALLTREGSSEYAVPNAKGKEKLAVIEVPLKSLNAD